jgi:VWFA-related protein
MRKNIAVVIVGLALGSILAAQDFQVRTRVDLVVVPTAVRDGKGKLVTGLTQKDFKILEDNVPQTISNFSDNPQQLSAAIVIDTGMGGIDLKRLSPLLPAVVAGFSEFDEMTSFRFDHLIFRLADFTNDQDAIQRSFSIVKTIAEKQPPTVPAGNPAPTAPRILQLLLGMIGGRGGTSNGVGGVGGVGLPVPTVGSRRVAPSRVLFDGLYEAAKALESRPASRRRIIFIVSDGQVSGTNEHTFDEITKLLLRDNIELYAVTTDSGAFEGRFGVLGSLARATGGQDFRGLTTASMENAFGQITEQARYQYVLGYHSSNEIPKGLPTVRTIEVKGRDPGWKMIHRKGYTQIP